MNTTSPRHPKRPRRPSASRGRADQPLYTTDPKFVAAVDTLTTTCGREYRAFLLSGRLGRKTIEQTARMAPPMQKEVIESYYRTGRKPQRSRYRDLVAKLRARFDCHDPSDRTWLRQQDGLPAVDTENFNDVLDRLARADGLIAKNVIDVPRVDIAISAADRKRLRQLLRSINLCTRLLMRLTAAAKRA